MGQSVRHEIGGRSIEHGLDGVCEFCPSVINAKAVTPLAAAEFQRSIAYTNQGQISEQDQMAMAHLAQQLQQAQAMDMLTMTIPTSPSPPEIVIVRSKANDPECLANLLPRLTPAQREAAITLATRCGEPRTCLLHKTAARPNADLQLEWMATRVYVHPDGSVTGRTHIAHSSIDEVEMMVRGK